MESVVARSIFSPATGFIRRGGFAWTCNPYVGCTFGCTYCYAMFLPQNRRPLEQWGRWLAAKTNAVDVALRTAPKIARQPLYLSSVTDPYLPIERRLGLTRGILEALLPHQPRLLVQTRGPLVARDGDLFRQWQRVRVNLSIPTDDDQIRKVFEPHAPALEDRWQAFQELRGQGIAVGLCVTPMLPLSDPEAFRRRLLEAAPEVLVLQDFHDSQGRVGADTGPKARERLRGYPQVAEQYAALLQRLRRDRTVYEGEAGFFPP